MTTTDTIRPYQKVRALMEQIGGTMTWRPMGAGGDWELVLFGKAVVVACRDQNVNALDRLYVAGVPNPKTWADYDQDALLVEGAFWELIDLVRSEGA